MTKVRNEQIMGVTFHWNKTGSTLTKIIGQFGEKIRIFLMIFFSVETTKQSINHFT